MSAQARAEPEPEPAFDMRSAALVQAALAGITEGGRTEAAVRTALLLMKAGTHRRQLSAMKRARELVGADVGLLDMPGDRARAIVRDQSFIVELEPERALDTLPELLKGSGDRDFLLGLLERLEGQIDANDGQRALLARIKADLSGSGMIGSDRPKAPAAAMVRGEPQARRARMANDERKRR
jgi:hypothetical protein